MRLHYKSILSAPVVLFLLACNSNDDEKKITEPPPVIYKTDTTKLDDAPGTDKPPVINITDTVSIKRIVIVMKDSAATSERIGIKMANIYNNILPAYISQQKLQITGPRMAWYKSSSAPFFFEVGIPVNKAPVKLAKNIFVKKIAADSVVVAHYYGPYTLTFQAYEALNEWMKTYKKKPAGPPYEVYIGSMYDSTGKAVDPYKVRTDIIYPHK